MEREQGNMEKGPEKQEYLIKYKIPNIKFYLCTSVQLFCEA